MLAIKLRGIGKKHQRSFRLVVQERRSKLGGNFIEDLGWFNPHTSKYEINKDRAEYWMKVGAKPSMTVAQLFKRSKITLPEGTKTSKTYTKNRKEEPASPASATQAAPPAEASKSE